MAIYSLDHDVPQVAPTAWVADNATVIGQVTLEEDSSVWYGVVIRGDSAPITIGAGSNVQDNSVLHADHGFPLDVGRNVTIGHQAMVHGCTVGEGSLVGIQAVILNGARIGRNCLVGAGALVTEGKEFPDNSLILGSPAEVVRRMSDEQVVKMQRAARHYVETAQRHRNGLRRID